MRTIANVHGLPQNAERHDPMVIVVDEQDDRKNRPVAAIGASGPQHPHVIRGSLPVRGLESKRAHVSFRGVGAVCGRESGGGASSSSVRLMP